MLEKGKAQNTAKPGERVTVETDKGSRESIAGNEINSKEVVLIDDTAFSRSSPVNDTKKRVINRKRPKKKKFQPFSIKILASIENEETGMEEYWLYGDRRTPIKVFERDIFMSQLLEINLDNQGKKETEWEVFVKLDNLEAFYENDDAKRAKILSEYWDLVEDESDVIVADYSTEIYFINNSNFLEPTYYTDANGELFSHHFLNYRNGGIATVDPYFVFNEYGIRNIYDYFYDFGAVYPFEVTNRWYQDLAIPSTSTKDDPIGFFTEAPPYDERAFPDLFEISIYLPSSFISLEDGGIYLEELFTLERSIDEDFDSSILPHLNNYNRVNPFGAGDFDGAVQTGSINEFNVTPYTYYYAPRFDREIVSPTRILTTPEVDFDESTVFPELYYVAKFGTPNPFDFDRTSAKIQRHDYLKELAQELNNRGVFSDPNPPQIYRLIKHQYRGYSTFSGVEYPVQLYCKLNSSSMIFSRKSSASNHQRIPIKTDLTKGLFNRAGLGLGIVNYVPNTPTVTWKRGDDFTIEIGNGLGNFQISLPIVTNLSYEENFFDGTLSYSTVVCESLNLLNDIGFRKDNFTKHTFESTTINILGKEFPCKLDALRIDDFNFSWNWCDMSIPYLDIKGKNSFLIGFLEGKTYNQTPESPTTITKEYKFRYEFHQGDTVIPIIDYSDLSFWDSAFGGITYLDYNLRLTSLIGNKLFLVKNDSFLQSSLTKKTKVNIDEYIITEEGVISYSKTFQKEVLPLKRPGAVLWSASFFK